MVDSCRVEPKESSMVVSSILSIRPLSSASYCRRTVLQNCCLKAWYGRYLVRMNKVGLCFDSHLSLFLRTNGRTNEVKVSSSCSILAPSRAATPGGCDVGADVGPEVIAKLAESSPGTDRVLAAATDCEAADTVFDSFKLC